MCKIVVNLILLVCLQCILGEENRPKNQVVRLGSTASFQCKTRTFGHGLLFYYQRVEGLMAEVIHESTYQDSSFGKRLKIDVKRTKNWWLYTLTITNVKFYDYGVYICYDNFKQNKKSALLTVIGEPECHSSHHYRHIRYSCSIIHSDYFKIDVKWSCNRGDYFLWERPNLIHLRVPGIEKLITISRHISNVTLDKAVAPNDDFKCNCTFKNHADNFPTWVENIDNSSMPLEIELRPLTEVKFNVSASYNLVVEEPIMCYSNSNLSITYFILKSNNETTTNNVLRYNHANQIVDLTCYAKNGLNLEPLSTTIKGLKAVNTYNRTSCEAYDVGKCFEKYFYYVERSGQFLRLQKLHYDYLCDEVYKNITKCFKKVLPCKIPQKVASWIESLVFLCKKVYLSFREDFYQIPLLLKCQTLYPQQLSFATYLGKVDKFLYKMEYKEENPMSIDMIYFKTCINIANQIKLYCTTVAVRMYGSLNASYWHFEYFTWLKNFLVDVKDDSEHYPVQFLESDDCRKNDMGRERNQACANGYRCYKFFDTILSTYNLGVVYLNDIENNYKGMCELSVGELNVCINEILPHCSPYLQSILDPLSVFQKFLCLDYRPIYEKHHDCYGKLFQGTTDAIHCSHDIKTVVEQLYSTETSSLSINEQTKICVRAIQFLDCIQRSVTPVCGVEAALLQRTLSRLMLAHGLRSMYCYSVFSHLSSHLIKTSEGSRLTHSMSFLRLFISLLLVRQQFNLEM